jgi:carboxypeptidase C (cathepsin A)
VDQQLQTHVNPYSWHNIATMIYIDQPAGAGFSYADSEYVNNEAAVAQEMSAFLQKFFQMYPQYSQQQFFIAAESYGGRYAPAVAQKILSDKLKINLKGISIGNGLVDPGLQYSLQPTYASWESLINKTTYHALRDVGAQCATLVSQQKWQDASKVCNSIVIGILDAAGDVDVRIRCNPS